MLLHWWSINLLVVDMWARCAGFKDLRPETMSDGEAAVGKLVSSRVCLTVMALIGPDCDPPQSADSSLLGSLQASQY